MKLDTKQKVLVAIYIEYQKDSPNMKKAINAENLQLSQDIFIMALRKLDNEGLINIEFFWAEDEIYEFEFDDMLISYYGIEYVEKKLGIDKTLSGLDKAKYIVTKCGEWGVNQLKDFSSKVVAEMLKSSLGN